MLLAIDIGNTNITLGCFNGNSLLFVSRLYSSRFKTKDEFAIELSNIFKLNDVCGDGFGGAIISSVVPDLTNAVSKAVTIVTGKEPLIVGEKYNGNLKVEVLPISQLGADLIAASVAAVEKYPLPCLVADMGTATKIIAIDSEARFLGCTISPGVRVSLNALAQNAALLPAISLTKPPKVVGTNTVECMQSGIVNGTAAMIDGLTRKILNELNIEKASLVATGGYSHGIVPCCETEYVYDENLLLDGLKIIYEKAVKE